MPTTSYLNERYTPIGTHSPRAAVERFGAEVVLFHERDERMLHLNQASTRVWDLCDGTTTLPEIVETLCDDYGFDTASAHNAAASVVTQLALGGFVDRDRLDRLAASNDRPYSESTIPWVFEQCYTMLGVGITIRTNSGEAGDLLRSMFDTFETDDLDRAELIFSIIEYPRGAESRFDAVRDNPSGDLAKLIVGAGSFEEAVMETLVRVNSSAIHHGRLFGVHAAGLTVGDRTMMLPATRNAGKSTLAASCQLQGCGYVSDEAVALRWDDNHTVVPYPKPLWLRQWSLETVPVPNDAIMWAPNEYKDSIVDPFRLGPVAKDDDRQLTDVVDLCLHDGPPRLESMTDAETAALLVEHAFDKKLDARRVFDYASKCARRVDSWRLYYSDPNDGAALLISELSKLT